MFRKIVVLICLLLISTSISAQNENSYIIIFKEKNEKSSNQLFTIESKDFSEKKQNILQKIKEKPPFEEFFQMSISSAEFLISNEEKNEEEISEITNVFEGIVIDINSQSKLKEIESLDYVQGVYPNDILKQQLSNDTHLLMNTSEIWSQQIFGHNLTGKGVTIGILDSGLDLPHPDFNYCANLNGTKTIVPGVNVNVSFSTPHPFSNNYFNTTIINLSYLNADNFTIKFDKMVIDSGDILRIYDEFGSLLQSFSDIDLVNYNFFVNSDYVSLEFDADNTFTDRVNYGYDVTSLIVNSSTTYIDVDNRCSRFIDFYDFIYDDDLPEDDNGHGTHVAGIAASNNSNVYSRGIAPDSNLAIYKVCDGGDCPASAIIQALDRALDPNQDNSTDDKIDIISLSLGFINESPNHPVSLAIDAIAEAGIVPVIAAGNNGLFRQFNSIMSPGTSKSAITVGASYKKEEYYQFTNYGDVDDVVLFSSRGITTVGTIKPDLIAPGVNICSSRTWDQSYSSSPTCETVDHVEISGTSMSTPIVSGVVALIKQRHPTWTVKEIKASLKATTKITDEDYFTQGWGRIQPLKVINLNNPACVVEFNTTNLSGGYYNSTGSYNPYFNLSADISCNSFEHYELWHIPISDFDDTSQYNITQNHTLLFNETQDGSITLEIPRNKFEKGILQLRAYDTNSTYNNFDMFYVENTYDDYAIENFSLEGNQNVSEYILGNDYNMTFSLQNKNVNTFSVDVDANYYFNPIISMSGPTVTGFTGNETSLISETINQNSKTYNFNNINISQEGQYCFEARISSVGDIFTQNDFQFSCINVTEEIIVPIIPLDFAVQNINVTGRFNGTEFLNGSNYNVSFSVENQTTNISNIDVNANYYFNPIISMSGPTVTGFTGNQTSLISETINQNSKTYNFNNLNLQQQGQYCFEARITTTDNVSSNNFLYQCINVTEEIILIPMINITSSNISLSEGFQYSNSGIELLSNNQIFSTNQSEQNVSIIIENTGNQIFSTNIQTYFTYYNNTSIDREFGLNRNTYNLNLSESTSLTYGDITLDFNQTHVTISNISTTLLNQEYYDLFDIIFNETYILIKNVSSEVKKITFKPLSLYSENSILSLSQNTSIHINESLSFSQFGLYSIYIIENGETFSSNTFSVNRSKGNYSLIDSYYFCYTNKTYTDRNSNAIDDSCENDLDQDSIEDTEELQNPGNIIGGDTLLSRFDSSLYVNGSLVNISNETISSTLSIELKDVNTNDIIISFSFNFSNSSLDLTNLEIERNLLSSKSYLIVRGLNLESNKTKNLTINRDLNSERVCVKDAEISNISEISSSCTGVNETLLTCDGTILNNYSCTFSSGFAKITGLKNSAVIEFEDESTSSGSSTSSSGSSGGGGSSSSSSSIIYIPSINNEETNESILNVTENDNFKENIDIINQTLDNVQNNNQSFTVIDNSKNQNENNNQNIIKGESSSLFIIQVFIAGVILILFLSVIIFIIKHKKPKLTQHEIVLINYLVSTRKLGYQEIAIKQQCIQSGWHPKVVDKLFKIVNKKYTFKT
jgi:subtilisin family serine protease